MEHIEQAGIHSGDSSCVVPPFMVADKHLATIRDYTRRIARALKVVGLMNVQYAIKDDVVYVLEVNPRASRTVPYLSKATGVPLAKVAAACDVGQDAGRPVAHRGSRRGRRVRQEPGVPVRALSPASTRCSGHEMKSTGEVMGGADTFGAAFAKAQLSVGQKLPDKGRAFISVNNTDKPTVLPIARDLADWASGSSPRAALPRTCGRTAWTSSVLQGQRRPPNVADQIVNDQIALVVNTPLGRESFFDDRAVRRVAMMHSVPCITTLTGASAAVAAIRALRTQPSTCARCRTTTPPEP
jgi:carbamoyl-phosphate synthase large subunit